MFVQFNPLNCLILNETPLRITALSDTQEHIPFLMMLIDMLRPKRVVELGTYSGESYCAMCQAVSSLSLNTVCTAFTKYSKSTRSEADLDVFADLRAHHDRLYSKFSSIHQKQDIEIQLIPDASIDILSLVDMASAADVDQILNQWYPKMSSRGVMLIFGTRKQENASQSAEDRISFTGRFPNFEFTHQNGLLVLMVGSDLPETIKELTNLIDADINCIRIFFEAAGKNINVITQLRDIQNLKRVLESGSWRVMQALQKVRARFIPHGTSKEYTYYYLWQLAATLIRNGPRGVLRAIEKRRKDQKELFARHYSYPRWISEHELDTTALAKQGEQAIELLNQPLISLLTIVTSSDEIPIQMISSVIAQTYINWELIVFVIGNSQLLDSVDDTRIRIVRMPDVRLQVEACNLALKEFSGDYAGILEDCTLSPNFLYEIVKSITLDKNSDIIFTDEDNLKIGAGLRFDPWFKPSYWSPELLLSVNYLRTPLISRRIIHEVGDLDLAAEGAFERELLFRCTELTNKIKHIPAVLVHRYVPKEPMDRNAELRCIERHLSRTGIAGPKASLVNSNIIRAVWPASGRKVSIIIPTKDKPKVLKTCLTTLLNVTIYPDYEVILLDNGSTEPETLQYYEKLRENPRIKIVDYNQPFNWSAANNIGVKHATGDLLLFLNNDVEILAPDWLEEMARWAERDDIGVVGAKLLFPGGTIQHANVTLGLGFAGHYLQNAPSDYSGMAGSVDWYRDCLAVTGACMMMRRNVYEEAGGFDEDYILVFSDVLLCVQLWRKGYRIVYTPFASLTHHEGKTRSKYAPGSDIKLAYADMYEYIENGDPYFNPNLSLHHIMPAFSDADATNGEVFARDVLSQYALKSRKKDG